MPSSPLSRPNFILPPAPFAALAATPAALVLQRPARAALAALGGAFAIALAAATPAVAHPPGGGAGGADAPHHGMGHAMMTPRPVVSVQGEGIARIEPDLATVALGVTTQAPTAAQAMADNATRQQAVIDALKAQGIEPKDLQTQGLNLSPMQDYRDGQAPVITGYQAQNIVSVRVHDLSRLGALLDAMVRAGATDVQGISFSREDDAAARDEARTAAVADARRRAEVMAAAAGMTLGPLLSLAEGSDQSGPMPMAMMARDAKAGGATPVETGQMVLSAQVTGVWSLAPAGGSEAQGGPVPMPPVAPDGMPHPMPHPMPHAMPGDPATGADAAPATDTATDAGANPGAPAPQN